ncbi:MAG: hypothetical protein HKL99_03335 [Burkholderiales bacterium]|nr:hypothetical protein [Burkholderiales bacterium]
MEHTQYGAPHSFTDKAFFVALLMRKTNDQQLKLRTDALLELPPGSSVDRGNIDQPIIDRLRKRGRQWRRT